MSGARLPGPAALVLVLLLSSLSGLASAQDLSENDPGLLVAKGNAAMDAGDYPAAEAAVREVIAMGPIPRNIRAEAFRILGLLRFFEGEQFEARTAFLEYLLLDPDAHLDPALVPPEAITLLEDVRSGHQAEIESMRPVPAKERYVMLNLIPSGGQFQNGHSTKGIIVASSFALLLAANLTSYTLLKKYCSAGDMVCENNGKENPDTARTLKELNLASGIGLITLYAFSVVDGYLGYRKLRRKDKRQQRNNDMSFHVSSSPEATTLSLFIRY